MSARFNSEGGPGRQTVCTRDPHEAHYTVKEIAKEWKVDEETVRQAFIDEDGVLILGEQDRHDGKRAYLTIRIPESVLKRVYAERTARKFHAPKNRNRKMRMIGLVPKEKTRTTG